MARFSVYAVDGMPGYLVDVQNDLLDGFPTRVVIPLVPKGGMTRSEPRLNPQFEIQGEGFLLLTQQIATVPKSLLRGSVHDLSEQSERITAAVDFLMQGF